MSTKSKCVLASIIVIFIVLKVVGRYGMIQQVGSWYRPEEQNDPSWRQDQRAGSRFSRDGEYREAEIKYRSSLRSLEDIYDAKHHEVIAAINAVGVACLMQGELSDAESLFLRSLSLSRELFGEEAPNLSVPLQALYQIYFEREDFTSAERYARQNLQIADGAFGELDPRFADRLEDLVAIYEQQHLFDEAIPLRERIVRIHRQSLEESDPVLGHALGRLAFLYHSVGRYRNAELFYERALEILGSIDRRGKEDIELTAAVTNYAALLRTTNRPAEATTMSEKYQGG